MLEKMKDLLRRKDLCVLATVSDNTPHCSLMTYMTDEECREIYMVTYRETTKYRNLLRSPSVSLLIDTREEDRSAGRSEVKALTVSGVFRTMEDEAGKGLILSRLLDKFPHLKGFADHPDAEVFAVRITSFLLLEGIKDAYFEEIE